MPDEENIESSADNGDGLPVEERQRFTIVGVGASAGGLEALTALVSNLTLDSVAVVVVQHLSPTHNSMLPTLLSRSSPIEVHSATNGMVVEPNHVYVIPPNCDLGLLNGVLQVIPIVGNRRPHLPIDYFFRSLAQDQGGNSVGVVLSGTGTDGSLGIRAIKAAGGITIAQDPASAKYDGMPRSALASGNIDFCLPPPEIAKELLRLHDQEAKLSLVRRTAPQASAQEQLNRLFLLIRSETGNDLSQYKLATVERRIERRMTLNKSANLEDYVKLVQSSVEELRALCKDVLITVTHFFRDQEPFEILKTKVFPELMKRREPGSPIRIWVPASATGEEAYSVAIVLLEFLDVKADETKVQMFGTDFDEDSIRFARRGLYPENIALDVSPERLQRFFIKTSSGYQISRRVRDLLVFSRQNLLKDAPFSRIDLVSCRNVLIYLKPPAQKRVLRVMHYALNPTGYLMLGTSETVGDGPELFSVIDRKNKLYQRRHVAAATDLGFTVPEITEKLEPLPTVLRPASFQALADRRVLEMYGPPGVVINESMEILHFRGRIGAYLDPTPGVASFNLLRVLRPELHIDIKRAVESVIARGVRVTADVTFHEDDKPAALRVDVSPLQDPETKLTCLLVLFYKLPQPKEIPIIPDGLESDAKLLPLANRLQEVERELATTKDFLQTIIEEKESSSEELKSSNEELQSSNEELQSTNEELETSKEELQAANEEMTTVNEELQNRMAEISQTNDDFHNLLAGVDVAVIIVGMDLRIRRFTSAAERVLNLVEGDIGRTLSFVEPFVGNSGLLKKVSTVIESLAAYEEEVLCNNGRWYAMRIQPYRTLDHAIRGVVLSFSDIDLRKLATDITRDVGTYAGLLLAGMNHPLVIVDGRLRVAWANEPFYTTYQSTPEALVGQPLPGVVPKVWSDPDLWRKLDATVNQATAFRGYPAKFTGADGMEKAVLVGASRIPIVPDVPWVLVSLEGNAP